MGTMVYWTVASLQYSGLDRPVALVSTWSKPHSASLYHILRHQYDRPLASRFCASGYWCGAARYPYLDHDDYRSTAMASDVESFSNGFEHFDRRSRNCYYVLSSHQLRLT